MVGRTPHFTRVTEVRHIQCIHFVTIASIIFESPNADVDGKCELALGYPTVCEVGISAGDKWTSCK